MTLKEKIALGQLNKELTRGIISQAEYELKRKKLQGQTVDPKAEIKVAAANLLKRVAQKLKETKSAERRTERIDTERVAEKQSEQASD
jgi:hypothetical protein